MNLHYEFVELDKARHDRDSFDCGENELNIFIRTQAARHMELGISRTMVLPATQPNTGGKYSIHAFFTITPGSISRETLPMTVAKRLPHYPLPVFLLARMAVHLDSQGQGWGKVTLIKALEYLNKINAYMPAFAVVVDCLNDNAEGFYSKYGFMALGRHNAKTRMSLSMKTVAQLFL